MSKEESPLLLQRDIAAVAGGSLSESWSSHRSVLGLLTHSARDEALQREGVGRAAFLIRDAVIGEDAENPAEGAYDPYEYQSSEFELRNTISIVCHRICSYRPVLRFFRATCWILVLLSFIEPPSWCEIPGRDDSSSEDSLATCSVLLNSYGIPAGSNGTSEHVQYYPSTRANRISKSQSLQVETVCVIIILLVLLLRIGRDGMSLTRFFRKGPSRLVRVTQLGSLLMLITGLVVGQTRHHVYARLLIALSLNDFGTHREIRSLIRVLPGVIRILVFLALLILFYAWFGTVMFLGTDEGEEHFSSLVEGMWTLWICVTTANYPDVMMPAYNTNSWVALYFVSFMMITYFFLMNLILAIIVEEYNVAETKRKETRELASETFLGRAYHLLDPNNIGHIDRDTVMAIFCILNEDFPEIRCLSEEDTTLLFALLDKDGSSLITRDEFMEFCEVLMLEFERETDYKGCFERYFPQFSNTNLYQRFAHLVRSDRFETFVDIALVLNAAVIAIQSYPTLSGEKVHVDPRFFDGSIDTLWEMLETFFTVFYTVEALIKISVFGWKSYSENLRNIFDFTVTVLAAVSSVIVYYPNEFSDSRLIRMIVMARVLRLIRLLAAIPTFQIIFEVSADILPAVSSILLLLFFLLYFFAALGVDLYGGLITRDPANALAYAVLNTDFGENAYWSNNFNDLLSGFNVLFNLLVVNNWTQCEVGFEAVTGTKWVRFFFLAFHLFGVVLINNLVVAFVISKVLEQLKQISKHEKEEIVGDGEAIIRGSRAIFNAAEITGTKTSLSGGYIARFARSSSDVTNEKRQQRLRDLFTQNGE